ncbi:MAG: hypothetical protein ACRD43_09190 [Pyrinomonadaceae bacterium]
MKHAITLKNTFCVDLAPVFTIETFRTNKSIAAGRTIRQRVADGVNVVEHFFNTTDGGVAGADETDAGSRV